MSPCACGSLHQVTLPLPLITLVGFSSAAASGLFSRSGVLQTVPGVGGQFCERLFSDPLPTKTLFSAAGFSTRQRRLDHPGAAHHFVAPCNFRSRPRENRLLWDSQCLRQRSSVIPSKMTEGPSPVTKAARTPVPIAGRMIWGTRPSKTLRY